MCGEIAVRVPISCRWSKADRAKVEGVNDTGGRYLIVGEVFGVVH